MHNAHNDDEMRHSNYDGIGDLPAPSMEQDVRSVVSSSFDEVYSRGRKLGEGAFAFVFVGTHRPTGAKYAIKQVDRPTMYWDDRDALQDEIFNLRLTREGPNIVQLFEYYDEQAYCYLVTELMEGGELLDCIIEKKFLTEIEARNCCCCILNALSYMHSMRVAHRDIKPENILLGTPGDLSSTKLADFSFAKHVFRKNGCRTLCGTPGYLAPEMLERFPAYDVGCDVWSVGCLLFLLLSGNLPFENEHDDDVAIYDKTLNGHYTFHPDYWSGVSAEAKNLVTRMLMIHPTKRISAKNALESKWMIPGDLALDERGTNLRKLRLVAEGKRKMKEAVRTIQAVNRIKQLNDGFARYLETRGAVAAEEVSNLFVEDSCTGEPFEHFYHLGEKLGEGNFANVYRCTHIETSHTYAVKKIKSSKMTTTDKKSLTEEITALKLLRGGPHIIRLFDLFEGNELCFMVMEEMRGGDLLSRIQEKEVYTEREARGVCKVLFRALDYCHSKRIAHRDIKPENLLLVHEGNDENIKLADFGFAKRVVGEKLRTVCGTPQYIAPEIINLEIFAYDLKCDMWSAGVVAYVLLGGYLPFQDSSGDPRVLSRLILHSQYDFHDIYWSNISDPAKKMIEGLLQVDPEERLAADLSLECEWLGMDDESLASNDLSAVQERLSQGELKNAFKALMTTNKCLSPDGTTQHNDIVEDDEDDFSDAYIWGEQLGIGTFSVVHESASRINGLRYAVKRIPRGNLTEDEAVELHNEISSLRLTTGCPYIVNLHEVFDEPDFTYVVLECLRGGYLIDRIREKEAYAEAEGIEVCRRLTIGIAHCHRKRIAIRDLKPENILLASGNDTDVKISDFGYAKKVLHPNSLTTVCGTEGFVAPEIIRHIPAYDIQCDIWSLGVVVYIILCGYRPFRGDGDECLKQVRYGEFQFHARWWEHISSEATGLIRRMLTVDPSQRITAEQALASEWLSIQSQNS